MCPIFPFPLTEPLILFSFYSVFSTRRKLPLTSSSLRFSQSFLWISLFAFSSPPCFLYLPLITTNNITNKLHSAPLHCVWHCVQSNEYIYTLSSAVRSKGSIFRPANTHAIDPHSTRCAAPIKMEQKRNGSIMNSAAEFSALFCWLFRRWIVRWPSPYSSTGGLWWRIDYRAKNVEEVRIK